MIFNLKTGLIYSILTGVLLLSTMFLTLDCFVDNKITSKWYAFISLSCLGGLVLIFDSNKRIVIDKVFLTLILLIGYCVFRSVLSGMPKIDISISISLFILYILFWSNRNQTITIDILFLSVALLQALYALLQYTLILPTNDAFRILGSYANPAGLAACLVCIFPLIFRYSNEYKILASLFTIITLIAIVLSESRAGIVSVIIVSSVYFLDNLPAKLRCYRRYAIGSVITLALLSCVCLFFLKQNSAIGRTLIWKVTSDMITDNFLWGEGSYAFQKGYMSHQAAYFVKNPDSKYTLLAGNIMHPFNEYLLLIAKYGIVAFLMAIYAFSQWMRNARLSSPYFLCIISIGIFSIFSYPFQYPIIWIVLLYSITQICKDEIQLIHLSKNYSRILLSFLLLTACYLLMKDVKFEYKWNKIAKNSLLGQTLEMTPHYEDLYRDWNGNHLFLHNYAAEMNHIGENTKSLEILKKTILYWNDYDVQMLFSDNYRQSEDWYSSENHLIIASNMCPNRFIPLFYLHEIYVKTHRHDKALNIANKILQKEVKIPSSTVSFIKSKMKNYLKETGAFTDE